MQKHILFYLSLLFFFGVSCLGVETTQTVITGNPHAAGFDLEGSDPEAIIIADEVMDAMGGRRAWDNTRYIRWNFFGSRRWYWDKWSGDVRVEIEKDTTTILYNLHSEAGRVFKHGLEWQDSDTLSLYLEKARKGWINDAYWLFMPFKLKDSGVTLKSVRTDTLTDGRVADVLSLEFKEVGVTPENKYHIWVDQADNLIMQWAFYNEAGEEEPAFTTPWENYQNFGGILLAESRGEGYLISEIAAYAELDPKLFSSLEPLVWPHIEDD